MIGTSVMKDLSKADITVTGYHSMKSKISKKNEIYESLSLRIYDPVKVTLNEEFLQK